MSTVLLLLVLKHFIVDFLLQPPYMYLNKGNLRHPGGYAHAGLHGVVTAVILSFLSPSSIWLAAVEAVAHYVIDWSKVNIVKSQKLDPFREEFWMLLGLDQFLHYLTYYYILISL